MTISSTARTTVRPLTSLIGAEIDGVDLAAPLEPATVADIEAALARWKVVFFRDQAITHDGLIEFARHFGELTPAHPIHPGERDNPELFVVDTREAQAQFGHTGERSQFAPPRSTVNGWHTDITFVANPAAASILRGAVIPDYGGDTLWTNLVAAYEDLSEKVRAFLDGLQAVHRWHGFNGRTREGYDTSQPPPAAVHPVVRVHPVTGERALFVNPVFTRYIVGLTDRENEHLLALLFEQLARPEFTVRFKWETGSVAFWDNRATAHLGPVDLASSAFDRRVERVTLAGELALGPDGFRSQQLRGELFA